MNEEKQSKKISTFYYVLLGITMLTVIFLVAFLKSDRLQQPSISKEIKAIPKQSLYGLKAAVAEKQDTVKSGDNLSLIMARHGVTSDTAAIMAQKSAGVLDISKIREGVPLSILSGSNGKTNYILYHKSPLSYVVFSVKDSLYVAEVSRTSETRIRTAEGIILSSLWESMKRQGLPVSLIIGLSDVFAWNIDFYDVKEGDRFRVIYEEIYTDGKLAALGNIWCAWFLNSGKRYFAYRYRPAADSSWQYYDDQGRNTKRAFLKTPVDFTRISSGFSNRRLHPVLKIYRPHHGVDYAAPVGTPVRSIGSGTVQKAAYHGGAGKMVEIRHNSSVVTQYMHLSRFADGVKPGTRVTQGQVIGYVGSSGLSTGPHLDFRVYVNGSAIDPRKLESPPSEPVSEKFIPDFNMKKELMNRWLLKDTVD